MRSNGECSPERPRNSQKLAAMTLLLAAVGRGSEIPPLLEWLTREAHHERAQYSPRRPVWVLIRAASPVVPGAASDRDRRLWFAGLFAARALRRAPSAGSTRNPVDAPRQGHRHCPRPSRRPHVGNRPGRSIYLANLDGAGHKQILAAQGNLTGIAYTELPAGS